jgi:hypothetical protein
MLPPETLTVTFSRPNTKALAPRVVLAHPRVTFHPCTCELHGVTTTVAAALIGYDNADAEVAV